MGDVLLTTAFVRQIRNKFPSAEIDFLVSNNFAEIFRDNPYITDILAYDKNKTLKEILKFKKNVKNNLPQKKYDIIFDLQNNLRSRIFRSGLAKKIYKIRKKRLHKLLLVNFKKTYQNKLITIPEIYLDCAAKSGVRDDSKGLEFRLPEERNDTDYPPDNRIFAIGHHPVIAIAPGAFHYTKRWQSEKFAELLRLFKAKYNAEFFILGGVKDKELADTIQNSLDFPVSNISGATTIAETVIALNQCHLLITNDTGVLHLASARHIPCVAIFGSTVKEFGFIPYKIPYRIAETNVPCRPCTHYGRAECPKKHFNCMNNLSVEQVFNLSEELLFEVYGKFSFVN